MGSKSYALVEFSDVDTMHNGPIFDPQDYAQRPQNEYLSTYSGSVTAINPPQTWYHCSRFCIYPEEAT